MNLFAFQLVLGNSESCFQQLGFLLCMTGLKTSGHTSAWISTCIHDMLSIVVLGVVQQCLDSRLSETPSTGIERFFLSPNDGLGVRVHIKIFLKLLPWEGVELFDTSECCVFDVIIGTVFAQSRINLSSAEDNTLNVLRLVDRFAMFGIRNDPAELRVTGEFFNW